MSGIYGDTLLAFPEQLRTITVFKMKALINGGWENIAGSEKKVIGIYQHSRGEQLRDSNGNLVESSGLEFWSKESELNEFFTKIEEIVYRFNSSNNWSFEGGFYRYSMEKVVGNNGTESENASWNLGSNSFS